MSSSIEQYSITDKPDGGYELDISVKERCWMPITPEGVFPSRTTSTIVYLDGKGERMSRKDEYGFYYPLEKIRCGGFPRWDFGYAWVNDEFIYLNLYCTYPPDENYKSSFFGKYRINQKQEKSQECLEN
ncbi:MAG: hypothetical protein LBV12_11725 [Puniceicoccales bacterium]|jgi:hypothetical protein|nr:hypothetical protein [Puniceicoccales bacterium]